MKNKLLIADDDVSNLIVIQTFLKDDYELFLANNGLEVIENVAQIQPDLILLDWKMPIMDGMETLTFLKKHISYKNIPIIFFTGYHSADTDLVKAYENGAIDYVKKPFNLQELKLKIDSILSLITNNKNHLKSKANELMKSEFLNINYQQTIQKFIKEIDAGIDKNENNSALQEELTLIKLKINKEFEKVKSIIHEDFSLQNNEFSRNLTNKHPNLTLAEIKLCMLLKLNLETKEIAYLSHQTYDSVRVSRTRLRKKLGIIKNETLIGYLSQFFDTPS
jgi:DNA-binding response OmpR family regulator